MDIIEKASGQKQSSIKICNALFASFVKETCDPNDYFIKLDQLLDAADAYNNVSHDTYTSKSTSTKEENLEKGSILEGMSQEESNLVMAKIFLHFKTTDTFEAISDMLNQISSSPIDNADGSQNTISEKIMLAHCVIIKAILMDKYPSTQKYYILYRAYSIRNHNHLGNFDYDRAFSIQWEKLLESNNKNPDLIKDAKREISQEEIITHRRWKCNNKVLKQQIYLLLYGRISPAFNLHGESNLGIVSIRTLRNKSMISNFIILQFAKLLKTETDDCIYTIYESSDEFLLNFKTKPMYRKREKKHLGSRKFILLYPRLYNCHYTLYKLYYDPDKKKVIIQLFDSLNQQQHDEILKQRLFELYVHRLCSDFDDSSHYIVKPSDPFHTVHTPLPQQTNGYDCGIFCILYLSIITGTITIELSEVTQNLVDTYHLRYWVLASIIAKQIMFPDFHISDNKLFNPRRRLDFGMLAD